MKKLKDIYTGSIYANDEVLAAAPRNKIQGALEFFKIGKYVTDDELAQAYESHGLVPADIYALAAWNEENKDDERKYFATHWKDKDGKWCFATFRRWRDERRADVARRGSDWLDFWSFAGVRKSTQNSDAQTSALIPLELERAIKMVKEAGYKVFKEI